ncbi:MAG: HAD family hydrolase [Candidatus Nanopelagicales bacterium]
MTNSAEAQPVLAVLFDIDGTLVDTTYLHTVAWSMAFDEQGTHVPMAQIHRAIGMGSDKLLDHLLGPDHDLKDSDVIDAHSRRFASHHGDLKALPGARELLKACADRGLRVGLASSAGKDDLDALLAVLDSDEAITEVTGASDVDATKPDPDMLVASLEKFGLEAANVLFVGDSVWDVEAATRLDMPCIGVECGGTSSAELRKAGAVAVFRDPQDFLDHLTAIVGPLEATTPPQVDLG